MALPNDQRFIHRATTSATGFTASRMFGNGSVRRAIPINSSRMQVVARVSREHKALHQPGRQNPWRHQRSPSRMVWLPVPGSALCKWVSAEQSIQNPQVFPRTGRSRQPKSHLSCCRSVWDDARAGAVRRVAAPARVNQTEAGCAKLNDEGDESPASHQTAARAADSETVRHPAPSYNPTRRFPDQMSHPSFRLVGVSVEPLRSYHPIGVTQRVPVGQRVQRHGSSTHHHLGSGSCLVTAFRCRSHIARIGNAASGSHHRPQTGAAEAPGRDRARRVLSCSGMPWGHGLRRALTQDARLDPSLEQYEVWRRS